MSEELDSIQPGYQVGPYRIVRGFKGRGGMARIFEVEVRPKYRRSDLPRRQVIKVAKQRHQAALVDEADFLCRFRHTNVVRILPIAGYHKPVYAARERFVFGWGWYYAMELVNGGSLERRLHRPTTITDVLRMPQQEERSLSVLEALGIARQLIAALEHIHQRYVVNLDVKPGNILFRRRSLGYLRSSVPQVVLCDFGISRDLRFAPRSDLLGMVTPEYMSPEQALEKSRAHMPVDVRSDLFSLGIVLYEMLTGTLPFENVALVVSPEYMPPPPRQLRPSIPPALDGIVMRALAKDPDRRFRSASEMRAALEGLSMPFDWGAAARRTFALGATGCALLACLAGGGYGTTRLVDLLASTPWPTPLPLVATDTALPSATRLPATPVSTRTIASPTAAPATSTLAPTRTSTPTPTYTPRPTATREP